MAEDDKPQANGATQPAAEAAPAGPQLMINAQYIKDLSFENPRAPQSLIQPKGQPNVALDVDVKARNLATELFEVLLTISAEAKVEEETVFVVQLTYAGVVTVRNAAPDVVGGLLFIETPRLLFPFARSIISNATRDGGFPPLLVNPIDFAELVRREQAKQAAEGATATA